MSDPKTVFRLRTLVPSVFVFLLGLLATVVLVTLTQFELDSVAHRRFRDKVSVMHDAVGDVMRAYEQVLRAAAGLFNVDPAVSREGWHIFAKSLHLEKHFPGVEALGYVRVLRPQEVAAYEARQRSDGLATFRIFPEGARVLYTAVSYLEPETWRHRNMLGYDGFTDPVRRIAMERARDTGEASLSGKLTLVLDDEQHPGTLLYFPIYEGGIIPATVDERRAKLHGYVFCAFRMRDLLPVTLSRNVPRWHEVARLQFFDGPANLPENQLFDTNIMAIGAPSAHPKYNEVSTLNIAGREWRMDAASMPAAEAYGGSTVPELVFANGILISLLMAGIVASLSYAQSRSEEAQRRLTIEMAQRQQAQLAAELSNRELIHRVKNTIAIVTAIASQTERYSSSLEEFGQSFRDRLFALARVHDLLRPNAMRPPSLGMLIRNVLAPYSADNSARLSVVGPDIAIPNNEVVLLSLLFNELATNATKHGAWSTTSGGKVNVTWQIESEDDIEYIALKWIERDGPSVVAPPKIGFGMNVMKFSIERGLGGTITPMFEPGGFRFAMRFPRRATELPASAERSPPELPPDKSRPAA